MAEDFRIDAASMKTIVAKAIMEGITQEQRDLILGQAVEKLITPTTVKNGYREEPGPSPLQEAFDQAVRKAAYAAVEQMVTERPEFHERIRAVVTDAMGKLIDGGDYDLAMKVGDAVGSAVTDWASAQRSGRY